MGNFIYADSDCNREIYNRAFQIGDWELGIGDLGLGNRLTGIGCNRLELAEMGGNRPIPAFCSLFLYIPAFSHIFRSITTSFSYFTIFQFIPTYLGLFHPILAYSSICHSIPAYFGLGHPFCQSPISNH